LSPGCERHWLTLLGGIISELKTRCEVRWLVPQT
jgi:hypothetical protein